MLLWKDEQTPLSALNTGGGLKRSLGGMPFVISLAHGPGRVAFSRDAPGELVVLPLHPGMELDVREHAFLVATHTIEYSFVRIKGLANVLHGGGGMYHRPLRHPGRARACSCCTATATCSSGCSAPGEKILVEPGGFLYKDSSVTMNAVQQNIKTGLMRHGMYLAEMTGPGPGRHPVDVRPPPLGLGRDSHDRAATYVCRFCRQPSDPTAPSCPRCGAPFDVRRWCRRSGWEQQPPIKDMARIQFGQSHLQIEGTQVPVADFALAEGDWIYFSHHVLLWADAGRPG